MESTNYEQVKVTRPVDRTNGQFGLILGDGEIVKGDFPYIETYIQESVEENDEFDVSNLELFLCTPLKGVDIEVKRQVKVEMSDDNYEEIETEYKITRNGSTINEFYEEDDALDKLSELIEEENGREDIFDLVRVVDNRCTYTVEPKITVDVYIPPQEVEVVTPISKDVQDMENEELITLVRKVTEESINRGLVNRTPIQTGGRDWEKEPTNLLVQEVQRLQEILNKRLITDYPGGE
jgi:hypothetical protein